MKTNSLFGLIFFSHFCFSQIVRIPDPNFKQKIIALGYDTNDDNQIQVSEAQKVTSLYINDLGVVNLEGINSFTNLEEFGCYNNKLTILDVSKLKKLKFLYAYNNRINTININDLTQLEHLYLQDNLFIKEIDVSKFVNLKELFISNNRIKDLDVSGLNILEKIDAENNRIETIAVRKAPKLKSINLKNNPIPTTIDIRGLTNLEYFDFSECNLIFINFSGTINLKKYTW
jgi:protein phosphatase 1 regulatory subunit 7